MSELIKPPSASLESGWLNNIQVRKITRNDLESLEWDGEYKCFRRVYRQVYNRMLHGLALMWCADLENVGLIGQAFVQFKQSNSHPFLNNGDNAYIHSFRVKPRYRRMKVGTEIMNTIEDDLITKGVKIASLNVSISNYSARRFYARRGYVILKSDPGEWSYHDENGVLRKMREPGWQMRKELA